MSLHCEAKKAYHTPEAAARAARGRARDGVTYLRVYACSQCGAFHLTSKRPYKPENMGKKAAAVNPAERGGWGSPRQIPPIQ